MCGIRIAEVASRIPIRLGYAPATSRAFAVDGNASRPGNQRIKELR